MTISAHISIHGDSSQVHKLLEGYELATSPASITTWLAQTMRPYLTGRIKNRFAEEGDSATGKWAPLTDATNNFRESMGFPPEHPINVRTGALYNFVTDSGDVSVNGIESVLAIPGSYPDGLMAEKLTTAQMGWENAPARPVLALDTDDAMFAAVSLSVWLSEVASTIAGFSSTVIAE